MALQDDHAALENFHTELIFRIEDLRVKRDTIRTLLQVEEEEKIAIQRGLIMLNQRLVQIDDSLSRKYDYTIECDKRIHEIIEAATDSKVRNNSLKRVWKGSTSTELEGPRTSRARSSH